MPTQRQQLSGQIRTDVTEAAELLAEANRLLAKFENHRDLTVVAGTAVARTKITHALRILESRGAQTRPTTN